MPILKINYENCIKCGLCVSECGRGLIFQLDGEYPETDPSLEKDCLRCGHCIAICPTASISHEALPIENCPPLINDLQPHLEQVTQLIRSRRSIRTYKNIPVPRDLINKAIDIARYSPTGHNDQSVHWLVVDSPDEMNRLTAIGADWLRHMIKNQASLANLFNFPKMLSEYESGHDKIFREAPVVLFTHSKESPVASIDCITTMAYLDLVGQSLGLGCCWCGFALMAATGFQPMIDYLNIPKDQRIYGCLLMGYRKNKYQRLPERKLPNIDWR